MLCCADRRKTNTPVRSLPGDAGMRLPERSYAWPLVYVRRGRWLCRADAPRTPVSGQALLAYTKVVDRYQYGRDAEYHELTSPTPRWYTWPLEYGMNGNPGNR